MGIPIEKWARQATLLDAPPRRVLDDINDLARYERQFWHRRQKQVDASGDPQMLESFYGGLLANPNAAQLSVTPAATTDTLIWTPSVWTPLPSNSIIVPEVFRIAVSLSITYAATPGTSTWTARLGQLVSSPSLGATAAVTGTASATANAQLIGDLTIRTSGVSTTAGSAIGFFHLIGKLSGTGAADINQVFGHTVATFDPLVAQGLAFTVNCSVATQVHKTEQIHWMSWN